LNSSYLIFLPYHQFNFSNQSI